MFYFLAYREELPRWALVWHYTHRRLPYLTRRHSLFDSRVRHNGYLDTYSFTKDGKKITIAILSSLQFTKAKPWRSLVKTQTLLTLREPFLKPSKHELRGLENGCTYNEELEYPLSQIHSLSNPLLEQYSNFFLDKIPQGLCNSSTLIIFIYLIKIVVINLVKPWLLNFCIIYFVSSWENSFVAPLCNSCFIYH